MFLYVKTKIFPYVTKHNYLTFPGIQHNIPIHNQTHVYNFPRNHIPGFHIPRNHIILITPYQIAPDSF